MRITRDEMFLRIAFIVAQRGTCDRARVGAVLVQNNNIISIGYNGAPSGAPHCDDVGHELLNGHCIRAEHAEVNCLNKAYKSKDNYTGINNCTLYVTHAPCYQCIDRILGEKGLEDGVRINRVVYTIDYGVINYPALDKTGRLYDAGIEIVQHNGMDGREK